MATSTSSGASSGVGTSPTWRASEGRFSLLGELAGSRRPRRVGRRRRRCQVRGWRRSRRCSRRRRRQRARRVQGRCLSSSDGQDTRVGGRAVRRRLRDALIPCRRWLTTILAPERTRSDRTPTARSSRRSAPPTRLSRLVERLGRAIKMGLLRPGRATALRTRLAVQLGSRARPCGRRSAAHDAGYLEARRGRGGGMFVAQRLPTEARAPPACSRSTGTACATCSRIAACLELGAAELAAERASEAPGGRARSRDRTLRGQRHARDLRPLPRRRWTLPRAASPTSRARRASWPASRRCVPRWRTCSTRCRASPKRWSARRRTTGACSRPSPRATREGARLAMREHLDATERLLLGVLPSV